MIEKSLKVVALIMFAFSLSNLNAQSKREVERNKYLTQELNLSPRQMDDMKSLQEETFIQKNRMKDRMKADGRALRDNHDKKLRSILDEKQYYAYKQNMKEHRKNKIKKHRNKMRGHNRSPQPRGNRQHDRF